MMEAKLRVIAGPYPGETIQVPLGKLLVGRAPDCDVPAKSEFVSGHHCVFLLDERRLRVRDLTSKNGTLVNGRRIGVMPVSLSHDDIVSIGDIYFLVDLKQVAATAPPSAQQGTELFDGETLQAKGPTPTPPEAKPEPAPSSPPQPEPALNDPTPPPSSAPNP
jgi:pSer/pThr/pTyr-binding forkhead associated (FHA) protein